MSNRLHRKCNKTPQGFSKITGKTILIPTKREHESVKIVRKTYTEVKLLMTLVLHDKFGFGGKRLQRFSDNINKILLAAQTDDNLKGSSLSNMMHQKYKINIQTESDKFRFADITKLYCWKNQAVTRDEVYKLSNAAIYNLLAISTAVLKQIFKLSVRQINDFITETRELFSIFADKDKYGLDAKEIANTLAVETKYYDIEFIEAV